MRKLVGLMLALVVAPLLLSACGGGGGGGSARTAPVGVFVTDSFRDDYDHVWTTIYKVELVDSSGAAQTIIDDSAGKTIDLKTLRDASGERFTFLGRVVARAGMHARVRVTVAPSMTLVLKGTVAGVVTPLADTVPVDSLGRKVLLLFMSNPRDLATGSDDLVIDFDLANFGILGGKVTPALREGSKTGLDNRNRHEAEDYSGLISGLSGAAPNFTFALTMRFGAAFTVTTSADTTVFNSDSTPNPTLANGKRVEVRGTFTPGTRQLAATEVKIEDSHGERPTKVKGPIVSSDAPAGTFVLTVRRARGFVPSGTTVNIATNATTVFRSSGGLLITKEEFFLRIAGAESAQAEGVYNAAGNTLVASRVKLEDEADRDGEAEVKGTPTTIESVAGTFRIDPVTEFEGFAYPGGGVGVTTGGIVEFKDKDNNHIGRSDFFAGLALAGARVKVEGSFSAGVIAAREAKLQ